MISGVRQNPTKSILWKPNSPPQTRFLATTAYEALYGGAAGGGKSDALLMGALRYVHVPRYRALLLRRTFPDLERSLIDKSLQMYPMLPERPEYNKTSHRWDFPSGSQIHFGHLQYETDVQQYQSSEWQYMGFDELTHFTAYQFKYMLSRLRVAIVPGQPDIPVRVRAATNPGGVGAAWVFERYAPWLWQPPGTPELRIWSGPRAKSGETLYYILHDDGREEWVKEKTPETFSRVFVGARATDNPALSPQYIASLNMQDPLTRAQLKDGSWLARAAAGVLFQAGWFKYLDQKPANFSQIVRRWDFAATEPTKEFSDPDWTRGVKMGKTRDNKFVVLDVRSCRKRPAGVEELVTQTAREDGRGVRIDVPDDPGSAGKTVAEHYVSLLAGYDVHAIKETGDKETRARPYSAQVEGGNVYLLRGPWNHEYVTELEAFPTEGIHDDLVDASSGAFVTLQPDAALEILERRLAPFKSSVSA